MLSFGFFHNQISTGNVIQPINKPSPHVGEKRCYCGSEGSQYATIEGH